MTPLRVIALFVAALFCFGGLGLSAEASANDPWAVVCFIIGALIALIAIFWRQKK